MLKSSEALTASLHLILDIDIIIDSLFDEFSIFTRSQNHEKTCDTDTDSTSRYAKKFKGEL